jgi:hypothetical protein
MEPVIIGVDPHKLSATIEVVNPHKKFHGSGRFTTDHIFGQPVTVFRRRRPHAHG